MNCPRCRTPIAPLSSPDAIVTCPGCGSRLMTKAAARRSQGGRVPLPADPPPAPEAPPARGPAAGTETVAPTAFAPPPPRLPPPASTPPLPAQNGTMPPTPASVVRGAVAVARREAAPESSTALEQVLREVRAVREMQERILAMLEGSLYGTESSAPTGAPADPDAPSLAPIRAPKRKSVLLIDDDPRSREAALRELSHADVPVRVVTDGNEALRAIVEDKPDVIALELDLRGDMAGKDLINVIKATMEWVDIPIVLWTREPVASQKEARQIHGADELALKSGGAAGLLARVITIFRRG
jgi:CheY-like chemotaxis protein/DNA-directed RNA polymerase subunit RPC12/RpoP